MIDVTRKKKSTVKIVGATNTVHFPEYCYSLSCYNSIAPFGRKFNRNREKSDAVSKFFDFNNYFLISEMSLIIYEKYRNAE